MIMDWNNTLAEMADTLDVPGLRLDDQGRAAVLCDEWLRIEFAAAPAGLAVYASIGRVPDFARDDTLAALLAANLPEGNLGSARIGSDGDNVILNIVFPPGTVTEQIINSMAHFIAEAEQWRRRLDQPKAGEVV